MDKPTLREIAKKHCDQHGRPPNKMVGSCDCRGIEAALRELLERVAEKVESDRNLNDLSEATAQRLARAICAFGGNNDDTNS